MTRVPLHSPPAGVPGSGLELPSGDTMPRSLQKAHRSYKDQKISKQITGRCSGDLRIGPRSWQEKQHKERSKVPPVSNVPSRGPSPTSHLQHPGCPSCSVWPLPGQPRCYLRAFHKAPPFPRLCSPSSEPFWGGHFLTWAMRHTSFDDSDQQSHFSQGSLGSLLLVP